VLHRSVYESDRSAFDKLVDYAIVPTVK